MRLIDIELHNEAELGNFEKVSELLNKGADPNSIYTNNYTVLMHTVRAWIPTLEQKLKIVHILLENGSDPSYIANDGYNALMLANDVEIVIILLDYGVNITSKNATELMYNFNGNKQIKSLLKKRDIKTDWVDSLKQIYHRIYEYDGNSLYNDILEESIPFLQNTMNQLNQYKHYNVNLPINVDDEYTLYAISRINELLLLNFQYKSNDNSVPRILLEQYKLFWEKVGLTIYEPKEFHPFLCEIYEVYECVEQPQPKLISCRWQCLLFGELLFSRASVCIAVNTDSINKKIAEESTLYWCHKRSDRKCIDLSCGWGHNSQWSTRFRCDYWSKEDLIYNANHKYQDFEDDELSEKQQLEVLKHRCFVKTPEILDCFPYNYFTTEKYKKKDL